MGKMLSKSRSARSKHGAAGGSVYGTSTSAATSSCQQADPVHREPVTCLAAADAGCILSGSKDQTMCLFNLNTNSTEAKWAAHDSEVTKVAYRPGIDLYFSASRDRLVKAWRRGQGSAVQTYTGHDLVVTGLSLNTDGSQMVTGSRDNSIKLWDVNGAAQLLHSAISRNLVTHVHWAPDTHMIAQTGEDKEVRLWDARTLCVSHTFTRKQYIQTCCDISADGNYCLTSSNGFGGSGCEATLWDIRTCSPVHEFKGHRETIGSCMFLPGGLNQARDMIATCSSDSTVRIWDQNTTECLAGVELASSGPLTSLVTATTNMNKTSLCVGSFNTGIAGLDITCTVNGSVHLNKVCQY